MRERLIELFKQGSEKTPCLEECPGKKCIDCVRETIADHLIENGVVVSKMETTTDKDRNVPSKVVPHKVDTYHIHVGSGIWRRGTTVYKCPKCQTFVMRYCKFCFECGQALEWQTEPPKGE